MHLSALREAHGIFGYIWRHPANRGSRAKAVFRAIKFQVRGRLGKRTLATIGNKSKMWAELHYTASSNVVYANPPDWNEMRAWKRILCHDDLFVDIGSNVGSYALWAGELGAQVIAVEPDKTTAARLRENVAMNASSIEVFECAIADKIGSMRLTSGLGTVNHLLLQDDTATGASVEVRTLDSVLGDRFAVGVKIDVEGAERLVLAGAALSLADHRIGVLQIEWNQMSRITLGESRSGVAKILEAHGYRFFRPDHLGMLHPTSVDGYGSDVFAVSPTLRVQTALS